MTREDNPSRAIQKKREVAVGKDSASAGKWKVKLRKQVKRREDEKEQANDETAVAIFIMYIVTLDTAVNAEVGPSKSQAKGKLVQQTVVRLQAEEAKDDADVHSEVGESRSESR